jgi:hypothetical protein
MLLKCLKKKKKYNNENFNIFNVQINENFVSIFHHLKVKLNLKFNLNYEVFYF